MRAVLTGLFAAAMLHLAACGEVEAPPPEPARETARTLTGGDVVGHLAENGAQVWRNIPFAAPPTGDLRWRAPRPHPGWAGERVSITPPERCPQVANALDQGSDAEPGALLGAEDCLYLDVYAPAGAGPGDADRPVMMWIHGGANVWGYADQYDGSKLAANEDVVVAVVQYRLGPLGFFAHPALREAGDDLRDRAANFALLDQIAALDWLAGNAAQFGGDASNITIFGESAGGHNVAGLLASPLAEGKFHRAIIQSGSLDTTPLALAEGSEGPDPNAAIPAAERMAGEDAGAADLRAASLQAVYDAYGAGADLRSMAPPRMIEDGVVLPEGGIRAALGEAGGFNAVPVITGVNRDEMKLFNALDPELVTEVVGLFPRPRDRAYYNALAEYQSRIWRVTAVDEAADLMTGAGHDAIWAYRFDWDEGGSFLFTDLSVLLGAAHAVEIPFVFDHFDFFGEFNDLLFNDANRDGREALADAMGAYWGEFARTGDPGAAGGPEWTRWSGEGALMRFDSPGNGGWSMITGGDSVSAIAEGIASDERLEPAERCAVVDGVIAYDPAYGATLAARLGCA